MVGSRGVVSQTRAQGGYEISSASSLKVPPLIRAAGFLKTNDHGVCGQREIEAANLWYGVEDRQLLGGWRWSRSGGFGFGFVGE